MRPFCAILLLGIVAYVHAHECDDFAANVEEVSTPRTGVDASNKKLSLKEFLKTKMSVFYVSRTSKTDMENSNRFCTAMTHGDNCGGVEYTRKTKDGFDEITDNYFQNIQFETTFIGYNVIDNKSILFKNTVRGIDNDDYIFKGDEDTEVEAYELVDNNPANQQKVTIPSNILNVLNSEFALYSFKPGGYSLFVKCTGEYAWVTYPKSNPTPDAFDDDLRKDIAELAKIVENKKHIELEIFPINETFPKNLSDYLKELASKELAKYLRT